MAVELMGVTSGGTVVGEEGGGRGRGGELGGCNKEVVGDQGCYILVYGIYML